jgi:Phage protein Gp19/Gp15/Gp42
LTYAAATDVATRLGRTLATEEIALVEQRLEDVERRILRRVPELADKITADGIDAEDVKQVEADVVLRLVRNPDGYASETGANNPDIGYNIVPRYRRPV